METMTDLEVLIMDRCTKSEAIKLLNKGTIVFDGDEFEQNFDLYMDEWGASEEERSEYKAMIERKDPVTDWSVVQHEGKTWYIMYVL